jgi:SAM-dependent methyltransferase
VETQIALAHAELAARQLAEGAFGPALESMITALRLAPSVAPLWAQFSDLVRYFNFRHPAQPVRELLARALAHPAVDPGNLVRPVTSIALTHPEGPLAEPLLVRLLEYVVIRDAALERLLIEARRRMLDEPLPLPLMAAIAHQCFNTEYVFDETPEERAKVEALAKNIGSLESCAAYAAYRPLSTLEKTIDLHSTPLASLARRQIDEPADERRLGAEIPSLGEERPGVSAAVRAQYEANPYPRWVRMQSSFDAAPLHELLNEMFPGGSFPVVQNPRMLVAGCGTGQNAIATAQRFTGAAVLAVDLSRASLAYAKRKTLELGLKNIAYRQADLLALGALGERFDLVECSGVLHHLEDPLAGWRVLAGLRKPGGLMRIGLYSEAGRRAVVRARELIAAEGLTPDLEGIRACRAAIRARAEHDPLLATLARNEDFYSASGCRDLMFHAHEHRFGLPQVESMIAKLGLRFLGFEFPDSGATAQRYLERFPEDPRRVQLGNWHRFEQEFPDTFSRMYQFWVA